MKILLVVNALHMGGIAKSLMNYLPRLTEKAQCDLLVFNYDGVDKSQIPSKVKLLPANQWLYLLGLSQAELKKRSFGKAMVRAFCAALSRIFGGNVGRSLFFWRIPKLSGYDLAISYAQDVGWKTISTGCNHFVLDKVEAKYKAAFIHCDYARYGGYDPHQEGIYSRFDRVVCVSQACRESFISKFPRLAEACVVCENFIDTEEIREKTAGSAFAYEESRLNVVSVCRLAEEKGLLRAAEAVSRLVREGKTAIRWTVVGDGPERENLERYLKEKGLSDHVVLVGSTDNPYYYMKNADLFLLPSFHEAAPMVFGECQALGLPVLTTDTISARELVADRGLGTVCPNSAEGIYEALAAVLEGGRKPQKLSETVCSRLNGAAAQQMDAFLELFQA